MLRENSINICERMQQGEGRARPHHLKVNEVGTSGALTPHHHPCPAAPSRLDWPSLASFLLLVPAANIQVDVR